MGWTSTDARFYTADGKVNRKAECDALYTWEGEKTKNEVIKSSMRGSVYYAAVRTTDKTTGHSEVFAAVCLTSTRRDRGFNFGYKGMAEDMGPCEDDCPKGILVLLTDTESKYAKEWRERCWAKIRDKKQNRQSLASIKIGEIIEFERGGVTIRAEKVSPAYQFKTPWFKVVGEFEYVHKTEIKDWRIVADNAATPSEMPRISTETAETVNVSAEGENAENEPQKHISEVLKEAERNYQCVKSETLRTVREADGKWHTYFMDEETGIDLAYDQINHIPAARAAQAAEEVAEIRRYMNRLNGNHIADADYYLAEMREGIKQAEAARRKKNADTGGENKAERAKYHVSRFSGYKIIVGDREQGKVIAVLMSVNGRNTIEINDESANIATMGEKPLQIDKPIMQLSDAEVLELIYGYTQPPQSPETPQTVECTAEPLKLAQTA